MAIAFLHTSEVHIDRFESLVRKYDADISIQHYVNEDLLTYAVKKASLDLIGFEKEIKQIQNNQPQIIICTCSTYGEACQQYNNVYRIDAPVVEFLVTNYNDIAIAYTVTSTQKVSQQLVTQEISKQNKNTIIINCDATEAWPHFLENNIEKYEQTIAKYVKEIAPKVEAVFLAQASMDGAKKHLKNLGIDILSSPEFGVKSYLQKLNTTR
ncbi:Glutamate racemase [Tenacibaculum sp. 190524A02b]|uniref:hypothetical protein n=1 Tax=Tenacibaculum vairaonense TaxID=3137860 RepID=UPI0032B1F136